MELCRGNSLVVEKYGIMEGGGELETSQSVWMRSLEGHYEGVGRFRVGDGNKISFLGHRWYRESKLRFSFPNLYRLSCQRELTVQQICGTHGGVRWGLRFRRNIQN